MLNKKILSFLCAVSMITTLLSAFTIAHAEDPTVTVSISNVEKVGVLSSKMSSLTPEQVQKYGPAGKLPYPLYALSINISGLKALEYDSNTYMPNGLITDGIIANIEFDDSKFEYVELVESPLSGSYLTGLLEGKTNQASFTWFTTAGKSKIDGNIGTLFFISKDGNDVTEEAKFSVLADSKVQVDYYDGSSYTPVISSKYIQPVGVDFTINKKLTANFTALNEAIAAYEAKAEADYTAESWAVAKAAYDTAKAIDQAAETDQDKVDTAATALSDAIAALEAKPVDNLEVKPEATVIKKDNPSGLWTFGFGGTVEITGSKTFSKLIFTLEDTVNGKPGSYTWDFETPINATVTYGLNIMGCPVGSNITATVKAQ